MQRKDNYNEIENLLNKEIKIEEPKEKKKPMVCLSCEG